MPTTKISFEISNSLIWEILNELKKEQKQIRRSLKQSCSPGYSLLLFLFTWNTNCINKTLMLWWRNFSSCENLLENSIKVIKSFPTEGKTHLGSAETSGKFQYVNFIELKGDGWILKKCGCHNETQQVYQLYFWKRKLGTWKKITV